MAEPSDAVNEALGEVEATAACFERLAHLFGLDEIDRTATRVQVNGRGGKTHVRVYLDNRGWIEFDPFGSYSTPTKMSFEIAAQAGSKPRIKKPEDVREVATLIFWLGEHYEAIQTADRAWELGAEYLRGAVLCDVDMNDQRSRWRGFEHLDRKDAKHKRDTILHDTKTGSRYVRTQWFVQYLRDHSDAGEAGPMKIQRERHGWKKAGREGRIKATDPEFERSLIWAFLIVPAGWENQDPEPEAGEGR